MFWDQPSTWGTSLGNKPTTYCFIVTNMLKSLHGITRCLISSLTVLSSLLEIVLSRVWETVFSRRSCFCLSSASFSLNKPWSRSASTTVKDYTNSFLSLLPGLLLVHSHLLHICSSQKGNINGSSGGQASLVLLASLPHRVCTTLNILLLT